MSQTVLLTGASGYIAKHIALQLLRAGHRVRGSARTLDKAEAVRADLAEHLDDETAADGFEPVALSLTSDDGWDAAMEGVDVLMHTASPFPLEQPKDENEVIGPAVDGARRALEAAARAGVKRVILTSSIVAITDGDLPPGKDRFDEDDWTDISRPAVNAYGKSKTLAERKAWEIAEAHGLDLTVINPGFVLGAPLGGGYGTSVQVIARILAAKDPAVPQIGFRCVDVGDIAALHIAAMDQPQTVGQRILGADRFLWFGDMADLIAAAIPARKIVTRRAPNVLIRLLALFDGSLRGIVPNLGKRVEVSNERAKAVLGRDLRDVRESVVETAQWLAAREAG